MANPTLQSLNLKKKTSFDIIKINDVEVKVVKKLSTNDKYDFIMVTVQESLEDGYINAFKMDRFFHVNLVLMYTDIIIEPDTTKAEMYDLFSSNGIINRVINIIGEDEYNEVFNFVTEVAKNYVEYKQSLVATLSNFVNELPKNMENLNELIGNIDQEKLQELVDSVKKE